MVIIKERKLEAMVCMYMPFMHYVRIHVYDAVFYIHTGETDDSESEHEALEWWLLGNPET